ncbi:hypothetical protein ACKRZS_012043 [Fusarium odoratissimum]
MSCPTTLAVHDTAPRTRLPLDIQLYIIESLIKTYKESEKPHFRLSTFARVSKTWQTVIEKETFKHITITSRDLDSFKRHVRSYRKPLVKHILLEVLYNCPHGGHDDQVQFSKAVHALWRILSRWKTNHVTMELGIVSPTARSFMQLDDQVGSGHNRLDPFANLSLLHVDPHIYWGILSQYYLGREPLSFDRTSLPQRGATSLPNVDAIAELVIRRKYHPNISPITLYEIISSTPCVEYIHLERWCYGNPGQDRKWDFTFQRSGFLVPHSTKRLTYFEEFHTAYHQRAGAMVLPRSNKALLDSIFHAADRLEHIAVSYAFDARTFFDRLRETEFKALKTLALTSSFDNTTEYLFIDAAEAVKKMHALKILEIWNFEGGQADVFRYVRLDRYQGQITWQSTKDREISSTVERSWRNLLRRGQFGFDVKCSNFPMEMESLHDLLPHLKLGEQILRNVTQR